MPQQDIEEIICMGMSQIASTAITVEEMLGQAGYSLEEKHKKYERRSIQVNRAAHSGRRPSLD